MKRERISKKVADYWAERANQSDKELAELGGYLMKFHPSIWKDYRDYKLGKIFEGKWNEKRF